MTRDAVNLEEQCHWLMKTEPEEFSFDMLTTRGASCWDGVRNVEARNHLRRMQRGDLVFIYHTGKERAVVGIARVVRTAYRDPSSDRAIWSAIDVEAVAPLPNPVSLARIKADERFATCPLVRRPRLSVMPITKTEWSIVLTQAEEAATRGTSAEAASSAHFPAHDAGREGER
jgi:predicted RNA-binding protein with PUA-like domain